MNRPTALALAITVGALLTLPAAAAQGQEWGSTPGDVRYADDRAACDAQIASLTGVTCVVLYGHIFDLLNRVPINIQRVPDYWSDLSNGFTGTPGLEQIWDFNDFTLYSSPGFVEYTGVDGAKPRLHPERGITSNVEIAQDVNILGYWYMSADFDDMSALGVDDVNGQDPNVGVMPCLNVRMVLQTGNYYDGRVPLASGSTTKTLISSSQGANGLPIEGTEHACPDSTGVVTAGHVTEFEIDMGKATGNIPRTEGFVVYVEWYQFTPSDSEQDEDINQDDWNIHTGPDYPHRVLLPVNNGVRIETLRPIFFDSKIYLHGVLNSPWGSYDVDTASIQIEVFDKAGAPVAANNIADPILSYSVDHDGHFKPVNATIPWDYKADNVAPGEYTIRMSVMNWQHSASAMREAKVVIADDPGKLRATDSDGNEQVGDPAAGIAKEESPIGAVGPMLLFVGLALVLGLVSRRR